jgi:hypothetical protein
MKMIKTPILRFGLLVCVLLPTVLTIASVKVSASALVQSALSVPTNAISEEGRLSCGQVTVAGVNYFTFAYVRPEPAPAGVTYVPEVSTDFVTWSDADLVEVSSTVNSNQCTKTLRETTPVNANASSRFMRLKVVSGGGVTSFALLAGSVTDAVFPFLSPTSTQEQVMLAEPFANNVNGWTGVGTASGQASVGTPPSGSGTSVWYPSVAADGVQVTSSLTLNRSLALTNGDITLYMRVREEGASGNPNLLDANRFSITLDEVAPGNRLGSLTIRPGAFSVIGFRDAAGTGISSNTTAFSYPNTNTFVDFRLTFSRNNSTSMTLSAAYYDTVGGDYVSLGSVSNANISSGVFDTLTIFCRNGLNGGRTYFESVMVAQEGSPRTTIPLNAYWLPVSQKAQLQTVLDTYKIVALDAGDYNTGGPASVTLKSGQRLYGDPSTTIVPTIIVAPGTTGAVLAYVTIPKTNTLTFPASASVTSGNCFESVVCLGTSAVNSGIVVSNATLENNLFLDVFGRIRADTRTSGYLRNNRFIRWRHHGYPDMLTLSGDAGRSSYGNVFLWVNLLTSGGNTTGITNYQDLTFVGLDAESWNLNGLGTNALIKTGNMGTLRLFGMNGGNHSVVTNRTGFYDTGADELQLFSDNFETLGNPNVKDFTLRSANQRLLWVGNQNSKSMVDGNPTGFRLQAFVAPTYPGTNVTLAGTNVTGALPAAAQTIINGMLHPTRTGTNWEAATYGPVPDPAGPNWNANLSTAPDATAMIQQLIDTSSNGVAKLAAGIYYISAPLKLARSHGIVGASADTTAIVAKSATFDMIVADDPPFGGQTRQIILADLTLQGGKNGVHLDQAGTGTTQPTSTNGSKAQYTGMFMKYVTFRNMTEAGFNFDKIYGMDNNFFSHFNFINCGTGLKQIIDPLYTGGDLPDAAFIDKCVFYQSQFIGNTNAFDMRAKRADGLNAWINCRFQDNKGSAVLFSNNITHVFANCDFVNNGGTAVIKTERTFPVSFVNCRFTAGTNGNAMLSGPVNVEGCTFDRTGSATATIFDSGSGNILGMYHSRSANMSVGSISSRRSCMFMNNAFTLDPSLSAPMLIVTNGVVRTLVPGTSTPAPQLLFGTDFSKLPVPPVNY